MNSNFFKKTLILMILIPYGFAYSKTVDEYYLKVENADGGIKQVVVLPKEYDVVSKIGGSVVIGKNYSLNILKGKTDPSSSKLKAPYIIAITQGVQTREIEKFNSFNPDYVYLTAYSDDENLTFLGHKLGFYSPITKDFRVSNTLYFYNKNKNTFGKFDLVDSSIRTQSDGTPIDQNNDYDNSDLKKISYDTEKKMYYIQLSVDFKNKQWQGTKNTFKPYTKDASFYVRLNDKAQYGMECVPVPKSIVTCKDDELNINILPANLIKNQYFTAVK